MYQIVKIIYLQRNLAPVLRINLENMKSNDRIFKILNEKELLYDVINVV